MHYQWCGKFSSESERWKHMERVLSDEELFLVTEGTLYIADEDREYEVGEGEYLVMSPCRFQHGYRGSKCSFYWLHFRIAEECAEAGAKVQEKETAQIQERKRESGQKQENDIGVPTQQTAEIHLKRRGKVSSMERIIILMNQLIESSRRYHQEYTSNLLCTGVLLEIRNQLVERENPVQNPTARLYQEILDYVEWNFKQDITVSEIADYFGYHEKYLTTIFRKYNGIPLKAHIQKEKMEYARAELMDTEKSVRRIAEEVGYSDSHNFSNAFRKVTGLSPTQYRMSCRKIPKTP